MIENFSGSIVNEVGDGRKHHQGYLLHEVVGEGGQGAVYRATDLGAQGTPDETVAVKLHLPFRNTRQQEAFENEGHRTTRWRHPNVLPTFSYGLGEITHKGRPRGEYPLAVIDYAKDGSLAERLQKAGRLPLAEAVELTYQATQGVQYAHERGILHRDLKPANFLLERRDHDLRLKVGDFGIAVKLHNADSKSFSTQLAMGSLPYISPEQARGKAVRESDIYSMAVIAYELSTGRRPFFSDSTLGYVREHETTPPPAFERIKDIKMSPALEAIEPVIRKGLAKEPAERHHSMGDFGQELKDAYESARPKEDKTTAIIDLAPPTVPLPERFMGRWRVGPEKTKPFTDSDLRWLDAYDEVISKLSEALNKNGDLVEIIEELQHKVAHTAESRDKALETIKTQAKEISALKNRIGDLNTVKDLQHKLAHTEDDRDKALETVKTQAQEISALKNRIGELNALVKHLTEVGKPAEKDAQTKASLLAKAQEEIEKLKEEIARLRTIDDDDTPGGSPLFGRVKVSPVRPRRATIPEDAPAPKFTRAPGMKPPAETPANPQPAKPSETPQTDGAELISEADMRTLRGMTRRGFVKAGVILSILAGTSLAESGKLNWIGDMFESEPEPTFEAKQQAVMGALHEMMPTVMASNEHKYVAEVAIALAPIGPKTGMELANKLKAAKQDYLSLQVYAALALYAPEVAKQVRAQFKEGSKFYQAGLIIANSANGTMVKKYADALLKSEDYEQISAAASVIAKHDARLVQQSMRNMDQRVREYYEQDKSTSHLNELQYVCARALIPYIPTEVENFMQGQEANNESIGAIAWERSCNLALQCTPYAPRVTAEAYKRYEVNNRFNLFFYTGMSLANIAPDTTKAAAERIIDKDVYTKSWLAYALDPTNQTRETAAMNGWRQRNTLDTIAYWTIAALLSGYTKKP